MTTLKNRKYELIIGPPGQTGRLFDDLQISFKVENTGDSAPNKIEIEIYNLTKESRDYVKQKDLVLIFKAGYDENFGQLFAGYTTFIHSTKGQERQDDRIKRGFEQQKKEDADWISNINASDGIKALKHFVVLSLADEKLTQLSVINKVIDKLNQDGIKISKGTFKGIKDVRINGGYTTSAPFKMVMDKICKPQGLQWHIDKNSVLNIFPKNKSMSEEVIRLNSSSGLIGSPEPTEKGYKFTLLLRHDVQPGTQIYVESDELTGLFLVANVTHSGDFNGSAWYTVCECITQ